MPLRIYFFLCRNEGHPLLSHFFLTKLQGFRGKIFERVLALICHDFSATKRYSHLFLQEQRLHKGVFKALSLSSTALRLSLKLGTSFKGAPLPAYGCSAHTKTGFVVIVSVTCNVCPSFKVSRYYTTRINTRLILPDLYIQT